MAYLDEVSRKNSYDLAEASALRWAIPLLEAIVRTDERAQPEPPPITQAFDAQTDAGATVDDHDVGPDAVPEPMTWQYGDEGACWSDAEGEITPDDPPGCLAPAPGAR